MNASSLLVNLLTSIQSVTASSDASALGSFDDINNWAAFRQASGIPRGEPITFDGFRQALSQLSIKHSSGLARLAFGIIVSMSEGSEDAITFKHFRAYQNQYQKRVGMQNTLNLASTRINKLEQQRDKVQALVARRTDKKEKKNTGRSKSKKTTTEFLQLTGRSTSRRSRPPTPKGRSNTTSTKKSKSHEMFEEKMMMKYRTLRAAFRAIDTDNDHAVDWSEVQRLLRNFNMDSNDKHLHQIFLDADADGDGSISYPEFQSHFGELLQPTTTGGHGSQLQNKDVGAGAGHGLARMLHGGNNSEEQQNVKRDSHSTATNKSNKTNTSMQEHVAAAHSKNMNMKDARRGPNANSSTNVFNDKMQSKYKSLHAAFRWMDEDNDHRVSWEEMQRLLLNFNMNINDQTLHCLFLTADADDDGSIDFQEFKATFGELLMPSTMGSDLDADLQKRQRMEEKMKNYQQPQSVKKTKTSSNKNKRTKPRIAGNSAANKSTFANTTTNNRGGAHKARNRSNGSHDVFHEKMRAKFGSIHKAFRWMDEDSDQNITWSEIQRLLCNFNMNENDEELYALFQAADSDGSGLVDYQEFQKYFGDLIQPSTTGAGGGHGGRNGSVAAVPKLSLQRVGSPSKNNRLKHINTLSSRSLNPLASSLTKSNKTSNRSKLNISDIIGGPPSLFKTLQEKMFVALSSNSDWKSLYKALRTSDTSRSGSLDQTTFAYHLMEFGVPTSSEELTFLSTTMGTIVGPSSMHGMSITRAQSASIQRGRRRPSMSTVQTTDRGRTWGTSLRRSLQRPQTATMMRRRGGRSTVKSLGTRQISYTKFMKTFVLNIVGANNSRNAGMRPNSALSVRTIDQSLLR